MPSSSHSSQSPPYAPPIPLPPPPPQTPRLQNAEDLYGGAFHNFSAEVFSVVQFLSGLACITLQIVVLVRCHPKDLCSLLATYKYAVGIWTGSLFIVTGVMGYVASKKKNMVTIISFLVFSILCCIAVVPLLFFAATSLHGQYDLINGLMMGAGILEASVALNCSVLCCKTLCQAFPSSQQSNSLYQYSQYTPQVQYAAGATPGQQITMVVINPYGGPHPGYVDCQGGGTVLMYLPPPNESYPGVHNNPAFLSPTHQPSEPPPEYTPSTTEGATSNRSSHGNMDTQVQPRNSPPPEYCLEPEECMSPVPRSPEPVQTHFPVRPCDEPVVDTLRPESVSRRSSSERSYCDNSSDNRSELSSCNDPKLDESIVTYLREPTRSPLPPRSASERARSPGLEGRTTSHSSDCSRSPGGRNRSRSPNIDQRQSPNVNRSRSPNLNRNRSPCGERRSPGGPPPRSPSAARLEPNRNPPARETLIGGDDLSTAFPPTNHSKEGSYSGQLNDINGQSTILLSHVSPQQQQQQQQRPRSPRSPRMRTSSVGSRGNPNGAQVNTDNAETFV